MNTDENIFLIKKYGESKGCLKMAVEVDKALLELKSLRHLNLVIYIGHEIEKLFEEKGITNQMVSSITISERKDDDYDSYMYKMQVIPVKNNPNIRELNREELYEIRDETYDNLSLLDISDNQLISQKLRDDISRDSFGEFDIKENIRESFIRAMLNDELYSKYQFMKLESSLDKNDLQNHKKLKL